MAYCRGDVYMYADIDGGFTAHIADWLRSEKIPDYFHCDTRGEMVTFLRQEELYEYADDAVERLEEEISEGDQDE
jgi:hypothetical protein